MRVKRLTGPPQIHVNAINDRANDGSRTTAAATITDTPEVFTCELSGIVQGDVAVTLWFYNSRGARLMEQGQVLTVPQADIINNTFYFTLNPGTDLTGTSIYVHAVIPDTAAGAENVSFDHSSYHSTIAQVYIYAEAAFRFVYWSDKREIDVKKMDEEESRQNTAILSDERFVHIKTEGMFSEIVRLRISDDEGVLTEFNVPLYRNHKSVIISMKDMLACYCSKNGLAADALPNNTLNLRLSASAAGNNNGPLIEYESENGMVLTTNAVEIRQANADSGSVQARVYNGETYGENPDRYTDFQIGFMCHVEGSGGKAIRDDYNILQDDDVRANRTVYPFHVYEIRLSDLVACGLVSEEEAAYLTTRNHDMVNLRPAADLENTFNKTSALISANKTLLSIFRDNGYRNNTDGNLTLARGSAIRKVLTQVQHKVHYCSTEPLFNQMRIICRDAWQPDNNNNRAEARYNSLNECPYGEFFLNYVDANYKIFVSREHTDSNIRNYDADANGNHPESPNTVLRTGIALHKGSTASTGCLTFNQAWTKDPRGNRDTEKQLNNFTAFNNKIFPTQNNNRKLNFICIDERHAIRASATDRRYYDLIRPNR